MSGYDLLDPMERAAERAGEPVYPETETRMTTVLCECCRKDIRVPVSSVPKSYISFMCNKCSSAQHVASCPPERQRTNVWRPNA